MVCTVANVVRFQFNVRAVNRFNRPGNWMNQRSYSNVLSGAHPNIQVRL